MPEQYTTAFFESYRRFPDLNLSVAECLHTPQKNPLPHRHDFYELVLVCGGSAYHQVFLAGQNWHQSPAVIGALSVSASSAAGLTTSSAQL